MTPARVGQVAVICAESTAVADGIRDYSDRLVATLRDHHHVDARLFRRPQGAFGVAIEPEPSAHGWTWASTDALVLQYNPFWYGRRGFAPGLPVAIRKLRCAAPQATFALMVHENYIDAKNWKSALMSAWQRGQLRVLQKQADVQLCTIEAWTEGLRRSESGVPAHHLPVASNFADHRADRDASRARLGIAPGSTVLCTFGLRHPGRLTDLMLQAARAVGDAGHDTIVLNLGTGDPIRERLGARLTLISTGFQNAEHTAQSLASADIYMAALEDGASTRRGTLMAALQHEIAVVGTSGHLTDRMLLTERSALCLAPVSEPGRFVDSSVRLAGDPDARRQLAREGRRLYERAFDWPVIAAQLLEVLGEQQR
jgi:glycosyltransferase involved in cell wall biosynthesis